MDPERMTSCCVLCLGCCCCCWGWREAVLNSQQYSRVLFLMGHQWWPKKGTDAMQTRCRRVKEECLSGRKVKCWTSWYFGKKNRDGDGDVHCKVIGRLTDDRQPRWDNTLSPVVLLYRSAASPSSATSSTRNKRGVRMGNWSFS